MTGKNGIAAPYKLYRVIGEAYAEEKKQKDSLWFMVNDFIRDTEKKLFSSFRKSEMP